MESQEKIVNKFFVQINRSSKMMNFSKKKYMKIFKPSSVIAVCILSISIEKDEMTSSHPNKIKETALIKTLIS